MLNVLVLLMAGYVIGRSLRIATGWSIPLWAFVPATVVVIAGAFMLRGIEAAGLLMFVAWGALFAFEQHLHPEGSWWQIWRWRVSI